MILDHDRRGYYFEPENPEEQEQLEELEEELTYKPLSVLAGMLYNTVEHWKIVLIAQQITEDAINYLELEEEPV